MNQEEADLLLERLESMSAAFLIGDRGGTYRIAYEIFLGMEASGENYALLEQALLEILPESAGEQASELVSDMAYLARIERLLALLRTVYPTGVIRGLTHSYEDLMRSSENLVFTSSDWVASKGRMGNRVSVQYELDVYDPVRAIYIQKEGGVEVDLIGYGSWPLPDLQEDASVWQATVEAIRARLPQAAEEAWKDGFRLCSCGATHTIKAEHIVCPLCEKRR